MVITRKITLYPQGDKTEVDRVYKYIRNGMTCQARMMNRCISALYAAKLSGADSAALSDISKYYSHAPGSSKGTPYDDLKDIYPVGLPVAGSVPRMVKAKLDKAYKDGLLYGKVSLPTYKDTMPMCVHNDYVNVLGSKIRKKSGKTINNGLYHDYDSPGDLVYALENDDKPLIHIKFANNIVFDVIFGNVRRSHELRVVFERIFAGEYKICDSTIGFDRSGKKIQLNLSLDILVEKNVLDENIVVGVDIGMAVPAVCALNNDIYHREYIGDYKDFTRKRMQLQAQKRSIQRAIKTSNGGHGRKKKLCHLDKLEIHEREFARSYNHMVSRQVIDFALKYHAKYINLEDLSGFGDDEKHKFVLRNWSYYELQQMIIYKAAKEGIIVRFIEPAYTSQTCSICGHRGDRYSQSGFTCSDPNCKVHTIYNKPINADFNAARNIAMSQLFVEAGSKKKAKKKQKEEKTA